MSEIRKVTTSVVKYLRIFYVSINVTKFINYLLASGY